MAYRLLQMYLMYYCDETGIIKTKIIKINTQIADLILKRQKCLNNITSLIRIL